MGIFSKPLAEPIIDEDRIKVVKQQMTYDKSLLTAEQEKRLQNIDKDNNEAFALNPGEKGCPRSLSYSLELKKDSKLMCIPSYKLSEHEQELLTQEVQKWLRLGVVEEAKADTRIKFTSPCLLTAKKDSSSRLLCDMRLLNRSLRVDRYLFPSIDDLLRKIGSAPRKAVVLL